MPRRKKNSHENHSRSSLSINKDKPQQRYAANARERARMRVLSRAFCRLKTTLPWVPADTKLSKLDTLRLAASYIAHLKGILRDETLGTSESSLHPAMSLVRTWPFGFNRPLGGSTGGGSQQDGSLQGSDLEDMDEEEEDNYDYDGESISSCTWEEVSPRPPTKECIHLDTSSTSPTKSQGKGKDSSRRSSSSQSQGRARGKARNNNNNSSTSQVIRKKDSSSLSPSPLNKQNSSVAPRPLSQSQLKHELFHNESNNNVMFHHHHQHQSHHQHHLNESMHGVVGVVGVGDEKLCMTPSQMMTVTNLENAPPQYMNNDILVGIGSISQNNEGFVEDLDSGGGGGGGFAPHQSHNHHLNHHQQHEMHHHHHHNHIAPNSNPFGYGGNDLITLG